VLYAELVKAGSDDISEPDIVPHENVLRLTGRHFPMKIPPAPDKTKAMKRCKVCHKKKIRRKAGTLVNSVHLNLVSALTIASVCTTAREVLEMTDV